MDANSLNTHDVELREQDRWLPIANVARLMKNTLPPSAKVSKDAKECMQECVSEYISFVTSEASDRCLREKRKTINGEDILYSMYDLGFENYAEVLKIYLAKYREQQALKQERGETRASRKQQKQQLKDQIEQEQEQEPASDQPSEELEQDPEAEVEQDIDGSLHEEQHLNGLTSDKESEQSYMNREENGVDEYQESEKDQVQVKDEKDQEEDEQNNDEESKPVVDSKRPNNIEELSKRLTGDEPDIDTLTAGITNGSNENYF